MNHSPKKLLFENGELFLGNGFGADAERICEVVPNTAMVGYQEIFSDCAYSGQMVCMTYPLIGNYGLADDDYESRTPRAGGFIVREYNDSLANFRAAKTLAEEMEEHGVPGIEGPDTRRMARMLRAGGTMRAILCNAATPTAEAAARLAAAPPPRGLVAGVSCKKRWYARAAGARYSVAAIDCGIRLSAIQSLTRRGCNVSVLPYNTPPNEVLALAPDGVFLSGGPGSPEDVPETIALARELSGKLPIFGAGLGCQLLALAHGAKTYKLTCGHRGANHPVKHLPSGRVQAVSQSHGYAVDEPSLAATGLAVTHKNLLDGTVEGLTAPGKSLFAVQFHPEDAPGPRGAPSPFDDFVSAMAEHRAATQRTGGQ